MTFDGQAVCKQDVDLIASTAGRVDDHILAELLRLTPYSGSAVSKAILPFGHQSAGDNLFVVASGSPNTYNVTVQPFRAVLGAKSNAAINDENGNQIAPGTVVAQQDYRSIVCPGGTVTPAANASGNPRWDLVYAVVTPDVQPYTVTRKVKDLTSAAVTSTNVFPWSTTACSLAIVTGTAAASPSWPALPADTSTTFNIPIAYVLVKSGFPSAGTQLGAGSFAIVAPIVGLSAAVGGSSLTVADSISSALSTAQQQAWPTTRPAFYAPTVGGGVDSLLVALDLRTGSVSHVTTAVVDSRDWRGRICRYNASAANSDFSFDPLGSIIVGSPGPVPYGVNTYQTQMTGLSSTGPLTTGHVVADFTAIGATGVLLYCDAASGALKVEYSALPNLAIVCWLDFTRPLT